MSVTGQRSDQLSYVPRLFFDNLVIRHIESSVSQLSLFSTISPLWTQFWVCVDTTWTPSNGSFCGERLVFVGEVRLICVIEVLFADRIDLCQRSVLVYIELTHLLVRLGCSALRLVLNQLRLCLSQLRLCLVKRRLEWSRIDLEEEFSLPDVGPFLIFPSEQIAGDLRFYVCIHLPAESPDPFSINGNVSLLDGCDLYDGWWGLYRGLGPRACQNNE